MLLQVDGVSKSFAAERALDRVSFDCAEGQIHGLVGENGAGKSTLLKLMAGVHAPDEGEIRFDGNVVHRFRPDSAVRRGIAIIYQEFSLIPHLSVAENIYLGRERLARFGRVDRRGMRALATDVLERVGLSVDPGATAASLSVAEQQAVEIARALSMNARLLILDEPTAALAEQEAERLLGILRELRDAGTSVIFVSHRIHEVVEIADWITVLKDGRVVESGRAETFDESRLISLMVGRELSRTFPEKPRTRHADPVLRMERLTARNGAFRDVSLQVYPGEILGIAGLEGHGQREVLRAAFGLESLTEGSVIVSGRRISPLKPHQCIVEGVALVSDDRKGEGLILPFNIRENLCLATMDRWQRLSFINDRVERGIARDMVRKLDIQPPQITRMVRHLSGGNQQKVVLGKWLAAEPRVLLLTEPTRGIDVGTKMEFYELLRRLADQGLGIVVVSRDMIELLGLSQRVLVMAGGRLVAELEGEGATEESIMRAIVRASGPRNGSTSSRGSEATA